MNLGENKITVIGIRKLVLMQMPKLQILNLCHILD